MFIVFEGLDGCGKSTQARLLKDYLEQEKKVSVILVKEPSDQPPFGGLIRDILNRKITVSPAAFQLLFCADRVEQLEKVIKPALTKGQWIVADRYFYSTIAYGALDLDSDWLIKVNDIFLKPDIVFLLEVNPVNCLTRINLDQNRNQRQFFETKEKLEKVWQNYQALSREFSNIRIINGEPEVEKVAQQIRKLI